MQRFIFSFFRLVHYYMYLPIPNVFFSLSRIYSLHCFYCSLYSPNSSSIHFIGIRNFLPIFFAGMLPAQICLYMVMRFIVLGPRNSRSWLIVKNLGFLFAIVVFSLELIHEYIYKFLFF